MKSITIPLFIAMFFGGAFHAVGQVVSLKMDEVDFQSVNGLHVSGVTFGFTVAGSSSTEAFYQSFGPGSLTHVSDPSLTGPSQGLLSLTFTTQPTSVLRFGAALSTGDSLSPGLEVKLFGGDGTLLETKTLNTVSASQLGFSEGWFDYQGAPVGRAEVSFALPNGSFALDNLEFAVPEPIGMGMGLFGLAACRRRKL